jgi:hypothetical protein
VIADGGAMVLEGETGTELTWMTSSWKSAGGLVFFVFSIFVAVGSGVGGLLCGNGFLFGLVCRGARGGGGNNWRAGPAIMNSCSVSSLGCLSRNK